MGGNNATRLRPACILLLMLACLGSPAPGLAEATAGAVAEAGPPAPGLSAAAVADPGAMVAAGTPAEDGPVPERTFAVMAAELAGAGFREKAERVEEIAASGHPRARILLEAFLAGELYRRKSDDRVVIPAAAGGGEQPVTDAIDGSALGSVGKGDLRRVTINNSLRGQLRDAIARLSLHDPEKEVRLAAVRQMLDGLDESSLALLREAAAQETVAEVRAAMEVALALGALNGGERELRISALGVLEGNLEPAVRNHLAALTAVRDDGGFAEPDETVRTAARKVLAGIDARLELFSLAETAYFGLSLGSVLLLSAIGLAITFGVMGVINMAHGEMMMLGAYTTYVVQLLMPEAIDWSLLVAVPAAFLVAGLAGVAIERGVIRFLYGRPLETLLATFGLSLVLQQLVRTVFSPLNRSVATPGWMSGSLEINSALSLTYNRMAIIVFSLMVFVALILVLKRTSLGLKVRAVTQNRAMAKAMGVRTDRVDALTFGLGSGIAGVAGVALSQLTNVGPNLGQAYIIDSFMVVVFGGVGNLLGTLVGSLTLGVANKFLEPVSGAVLAKILVLVFIILFIQKRPRGLFPQKGRAAEA